MGSRSINDLFEQIRQGLERNERQKPPHKRRRYPFLFESTPSSARSSTATAASKAQSSSQHRTILFGSQIGESLLDTSCVPSQKPKPKPKPSPLPLKFDPPRFTFVASNCTSSDSVKLASKIDGDCSVQSKLASPDEAPSGEALACCNGNVSKPLGGRRRISLKNHEGVSEQQHQMFRFGSSGTMSLAQSRYGYDLSNRELSRTATHRIHEAEGSNITSSGHQEEGLCKSRSQDTVQELSSPSSDISGTSLVRMSRSRRSFCSEFSISSTQENSNTPFVKPATFPSEASSCSDSQEKQGNGTPGNHVVSLSTISMNSNMTSVKTSTDSSFSEPTLRTSLHSGKTNEKDMSCSDSSLYPWRTEISSPRKRRTGDGSEDRVTGTTGHNIGKHTSAEYSYSFENTKDVASKPAISGKVWMTKGEVGSLMTFAEKWAPVSKRRRNDESSMDESEGSIDEV